jgi:predicted porin
MNKKLVAVAIAGLLAAPLAQAQTANVTLYGRVNLDMEFVNGRKANNTNPNIYRVSSNSSRFGLRGTESLGGGLNAIWQMENGSVNMTNGGGNLGGRDSFIGLSGSWGTFKMGRFLAPYDDIHGIFGNDSTYSTSILSTASLWAQGFAGQPESGGFDDRLQKSIRYDTPAMSGFRIAAQFATNAGAPASNSNNQSYFVGYRNGPLNIGAAYELHHNIRGTATAPLTDHAFSVAGLYQFSQFNIAAVYEKLDYDVTPTTNLKRDFWGVSSHINVGANGKVFLFWGTASDGKGSAVDTPAPIVTPAGITTSNVSRVAGLAKGDNTGSNQWEISYAYDLSKRTKVYTGYVKINNDSNANYTFNINSYAVAAGGKPGGFVMGMGHSF